MKPGDPDVEWIEWDAQPRFRDGMFVAQVRGRSMEPLIPDGSYCLFERADMPSSPERAVLVRYSGQADPETGGQYSVKQLRSEEDGVVLRSVNRDFADVVVDGEVRVIGEVVCVIGSLTL